jgi:hypothetical protein
LSADQAARLTQAAECRDEILSELWKALLIDLAKHPASLFDPSGQLRRESDAEFLRRIT